MKNKLMICLLACFLCWPALMAQAPKWVEKAKRAVISVVTYDENDQILNTGNGFFITEDGVALSDYSLFKGAHRAVVFTSAGKQMPVESIMGANDMYDVIKFKVGIVGKRVPALSVASATPAVGTEVYLLPYATQKDRSYTSGKVKEADQVGENNIYYTLNLRLKDKMVSCPLMTATGEVFGLAQKASGQDTATISYAVDARFAQKQHITALSYGDLSLRGIGIKKALPDTEEQALVFLYMVGSQVSAEQYAALLDEFIAQYPNSADGYMRRASNRLAFAKGDADMDQVVADMDRALEVAQKKDDTYYNRAKMIYSYLLERTEQPYAAWTFDKALHEIAQAIAIQALPIYTQLEGDIRFAQKDYAGALTCYEKVNESNLKSPASVFSVMRTKELLEAPQEELMALMDSCVAMCQEPYTEAAAPYLLERAQRRVAAGNARMAVVDYDAYYKAMNGKVNDLFYFYHEQAAMKAKQFQRALDDMVKAIELNPKDLTYRAELAVINIRVGRNEEALKVLKEALAIDPKYSEAYRLMGLAHIQLKQKKEACDCFAKAKELGDPNVEALIKKHCN